MGELVSDEELLELTKEDLEEAAGTFYTMAGAAHDAKDAHGTPEFREKVDRLIKVVEDGLERLDRLGEGR